MEFFLLALIGIVLGVSAAIPGLSMGTMAVTFNVYDRLIGVITPNIKKIFESWKFWLPLLTGIGAGIVLFSKLAAFLFNNYPVPTYWFFIGLIAGSIPLIYGRIKNESSDKQKASKIPPVSSIICLVIALAVIIIFALISPEETTAVYTELTPKLFLLLFLGGIFSALAMIVPGISGSFMLLLIGMYRTVIQSVSDFNVPVLCVLALGVLIGLFSGAAGIRFLLAKAPKATYGAVLGLIVGSVFILFKIPENGFILMFSILTFAVGFAISFFAGKKK